MNSVTEHKITVFSIQSLYNPSSSIVSSYKPVHLQLCVNQSLRKNINPRTMVSGSFLINLSVNHGFQDHFYQSVRKPWFQDDFSSICPRTRVSGSFLIIARTKISGSFFINLVSGLSLINLYENHDLRIIFDQPVHIILFL